MAEYLVPGVYIEEKSFRANIIEGVSTSTAGFVGRAEWGAERRPVLVTSFDEFRRKFGRPIPSPFSPGDHLGHAVRGFFENGGRRAYVVRVLGEHAGPASWTAIEGSIHRILDAPTRTDGATYRLDTIQALRPRRGTTAGSSVRIFRRDRSGLPWAQVTTTSGGSPVSEFEVTASDVGTSAVTLNPPPGIQLQPDNSYLERVGVTRGSGPVFTAKEQGTAGQRLSVQIQPADLSPVPILNANSTTATVEVERSLGFYAGAIVELKVGEAQQSALVTRVAGNELTLEPPSGTTLPPLTPLGTNPWVRLLAVDILVYVDGSGVASESFHGLSWNANSARYYVTRVNERSRLLTVTRSSPPAPSSATRPCTPGGFPASFQGGSDGDPPTNAELQEGIQFLEQVEDLSLVAVPGVTATEVRDALIGHCERLKYRFAVLDGLDSEDVSQVKADRLFHDSSYAALYAPWLITTDLETATPVRVPPSGHVMGVIARSDNERGVFKAPANETVRGISDLGVLFTTGAQEVLNPAGINLIRALPGRGKRVWGARTISSDPLWRYINVRRLFLFLEQSIDRATQWVVFEPNGEALWRRVRDTVDPFLYGVWKSGALLGSTSEEAYFVRCDRSTMTEDDIDNGRLVCLIGAAAVRPAEFVVFRIGQFTATRA